MFPPRLSREALPSDMTPREADEQRRRGGAWWGDETARPHSRNLWPCRQFWPPTEEVCTSRPGDAIARTRQKAPAGRARWGAAPRGAPDETGGAGLGCEMRLDSPGSQWPPRFPGRPENKKNRPAHLGASGAVKTGEASKVSGAAPKGLRTPSPNSVSSDDSSPKRIRGGSYRKKKIHHPARSAS